MPDRPGYDIDRAAIDELFAKDEAARHQVLSDYLDPREKLIAKLGVKRDPRNHFWTVPTPSPNGPITPQMAAAALLVQTKLKGLEAPLLADEFVGKAVAAVYCGCSEAELDRRIRSPSVIGLAELERNGQSRLVDETDEHGKPLPGNRKRREFRMAKVMERKNVRSGGGAESEDETPAPPAAPQPSAPPAPSLSPAVSVKAEAAPGKFTLTLEMALTDDTPWLENAAQQIVAHLLHNRLDPEAIARVLAEGGDIVRRTLKEVLHCAWATLEARQPWADGYAALLAREAEALEVANAVARDREFELLPTALPDDKSEKKRL